MSTPGTEPISTAAARSSLRSPKSAWPNAAAVTSGIAWTRSVPTRSFARSRGYSASSTTMISEPEPTEVSPTTRPPAAPTRTVGTGLTLIGRAGPSSRRRRAVHDLTSRPVAAINRATPSMICITCWTVWSSPSSRSSNTPRKALGTLPTHSQRTSGQFTVPRRACTKPPKGFITALAARSLETAATGGTPKTSTRMGVIRAPPPIPVRPTTMPTPSPASARVKFIARVSATNTHLVY